MQSAFTSFLPIILSKEVLQEVVGLPFVIYPFNIFGGIILAVLITIVNESKYAEEMKKRRVSLQQQFLQALTGIIVGVVVAIILAIIWGYLINIMRVSVQFISGGPFGSFLYGMFSVLLKPLGISELYQTFERFTSIGGAWNIPAPVNSYVYGNESIWLAQLAYNGGKFTVGTQSAVQYVHAIFIIPAVALAVINSSFVEHRKTVKLVMFVFLLISAFVGFTLPIEIIILFTAPLLFLFIAVLYGLISLILVLLSTAMDIHLITVSGGGIFDLIAFGILPGAQKTGAWVLLLIGAIASVATYFAVFYLIKKFKIKTFGRNKEELSMFADIAIRQNESEAVTVDDKVDIMIQSLGGYENIKDLTVSMYRLHIQVVNPEKVVELPIKQNGAAGIFVVQNSVQIILGALTNEYYTIMQTKLDDYR